MKNLKIWSQLDLISTENFLIQQSSFSLPLWKGRGGGDFFYQLKNIKHLKNQQSTDHEQQEAHKKASIYDPSFVECSFMPQTDKRLA